MCALHTRCELYTLCKLRHLDYFSQFPTDLKQIMRNSNCVSDDQSGPQPKSFRCAFLDHSGLAVPEATDNSLKEAMSKIWSSPAKRDFQGVCAASSYSLSLAPRGLTIYCSPCLSAPYCAGIPPISLIPKGVWTNSFAVNSSEPGETKQGYFYLQQYIARKHLFHNFPPRTAEDSRKTKPF